LRSGQRLDANQEFIGQGLANIVGAFTSSYPSSGSFNRTGANFDAGAKTPLAAVFSALALLAILLLTAPVVAYMPLAAMAGLLFVVAAGLIDARTMRHIAHTSHAEAAVLAITFVVTLTMPLEFAIFVGVLASLLVYLNRTTHPRMTVVAPDPALPSRLVPIERTAAAPQAAPVIVLMEGSVFFGAVDHVHEEMEHVRMAAGPGRPILLVGTGMNFIDVAGAELLLYEARRTRESGGALHLCMLKEPVRELLERGGYVDRLGRDRIYDTVDEALAALGACDSAPVVHALESTRS
jgi:SulP family sulfate permease